MPKIDPEKLTVNGEKPRNDVRVVKLHQLGGPGIADVVQRAARVADERAVEAADVER